jgi:hypothetical protein
MGGDSAPVTPTDAVAGLLRVLEGLKPSDSGRFLDRQGMPMSW